MCAILLTEYTPEVYDPKILLPRNWGDKCNSGKGVQREILGPITLAKIKQPEAAFTLSIHGTRFPSVPA
jgi:hypothetical protein